MNILIAQADAEWKKCKELTEKAKAAESARLAELAEAARRKADHFRVTEIELEVH